MPHHYPLSICIFAQHGIPKVAFCDNGPQYSSHEFKKFPQSWDFIHKTFSILSSLRIMGLWRELFKPFRKLYKNAEDNSDPYLAMLALYTTKNSSGTSTLELLMKRKLQTLVTSINVNVNTKTKLKKLTVS